MDTPPLPASPPCTDWCQNHDGHEAEWDTSPGAVTKTCTRCHSPGADVDGVPVTVTLERFAELADGAVLFGETVLRLECDGALNAATAARLGETLRNFAGQVAERAVA